jgi:hypothetical protein
LKESITLSPNQGESGMPFTSNFGMFDPAELATIQAVFDRLCEERRLGSGPINSA